MGFSNRRRRRWKFGSLPWRRFLIGNFFLRFIYKLFNFVSLFYANICINIDVCLIKSGYQVLDGLGNHKAHDQLCSLNVQASESPNEIRPSQPFNCASWATGWQYPINDYWWVGPRAWAKVRSLPSRWGGCITNHFYKMHPYIDYCWWPEIARAHVFAI